MKNQHKMYVLKNKSRFFCTVIIFTILVCTIFIAGNAYGSKDRLNTSITVSPGDTLWDISKKYNKKGDLRYFIYKIKELNNLNDSSIFAGQQLLIPLE